MIKLIIAAHPDDEILGCGGMIRKSKTGGSEVYVLLLTDGAMDRYTKQKSAILKKNAFEANRFIGTKKVYFEKFPNQKLDTVSLTQIIRSIEKYIDMLKPEAIFTHHQGDLNNDHRIVCAATLTATRPFPGQVVKKVYSYFVASSTEWNFSDAKDLFIPNTFIDINREIREKVAAMKHYATEIRPYPHPRSTESIKTYASYWGMVAGLGCAEPYQLIRDIKDNL